LLSDQIRGACRIHPLPNELLAQEGVQRLHALPLSLVIEITVLGPEGAEEPLEHAQGAQGGVGLAGGGDEEGGVLCPVGGKLGHGLRGEEEGRGAEGGEVTFEGGEGLAGQF
jgi:hypothetical protein